MKTLKKFLAVTLAVLMILSITPINALAAENCQHEWETPLYEYVGDVKVDGNHYCRVKCTKKCKKCGTVIETEEKTEHTYIKKVYLNFSNPEECSARIKRYYDDVMDTDPNTKMTYETFYAVIYNYSNNKEG